ncbi:MAG: AAA family ATPase [Enterococcus sp.]|nr:AAA family ATPase [Enterococcus sp.]
MKFVMIIGPQAVGKMTVGQELAKKTSLKLFHNHMTIELLEPLFGFSSELWQLSDLFRYEIFKKMAESKEAGLIFTYVWAFDLQADWDFVNRVTALFESKNATVYFVELEADLTERLERNKSPHRLAHKPTKRNIERSENELKKTIENHRLHSFEGEIKNKNYLRINNTYLEAQEVADLIIDKFHL